MANKFTDFLASIQNPQDNQPYSQMSPEQAQMLSQMGAQQRMPDGQAVPPPVAPTPQMAPSNPQQMMVKTAGASPVDLSAYKSKLDDYNSQYKDSLGKLQGYMQDYRTTEQPTDYRPIAAFLGSLPQNKNTQLLEAANAMAPESKAKQQQNAIANQQQYVKDIGEMAKNSDYVKMLNGQMNQQNAILRNQTALARNSMQGQRLTFQEEKEARGTVNNDNMLKQYGPRLEGAAKIDELIEAANHGHVVSNQALLGQLNAEIARLETGSQAPGLHAAEKTELNSYAAQMGALRDSITGNPQDSVDPRILDTARKMVKELSGSYMKGIDSRMDTLQSGMRDNQRGIVQEKHDSMINTYAPRFGGWNGLKQVKIYQGQKYEMQGDQWVPVGEAIMGGAYKVGEAPWEQNNKTAQVPVPQAPPSNPSGAGFKVGQAPWETNQPASSHEAAPAGPEKTGIAESALQGFGQGVTLGYLPEIQAGVETGLNKILPESMGGQDPMLDYQKSLQQWRAQNDTMKEEHPLATTGGNVAGALMTLPMGGTVGQGSRALKAAQAVGFGKNALTAAKIGQAGLVGAGYGALANTENPEGDYLDLKQRLGNAGTGALFGAGGESLALGGSAALKAAADTLKNSAIVKQIGAKGASLKSIIKKDQIPQIGKFMQDEGLMGISKNAEKVVEHTKDIMETDGPKIGQLYQDAQAKAEVAKNALGVNNSGTKISGPELADQIMNEVKAKAKNNPNRDQVIREMESSLQPLRDMGDNANISDIHDFRKGVDENIDWSKSAREKGIMQRAYVTARNAISDKTNDVIKQLDTVLGGNQVKELDTLNKRFSNAAVVNNTATQQITRDLGATLRGGVINGAGGLFAGQAEYSRSHDPINAIGAGILGMAATGAARKVAVPLSFQSGRAAGAIGRGLEKIGNKAGMVGGAAAAAESPWMSMNKKEKAK